MKKLTLEGNPLQYMLNRLVNFREVREDVNAVFLKKKISKILVQFLSLKSTNINCKE